MLSQLSGELNSYQGNLWTVIISLSREDAERLGFDTATRWRDFLRSERSEIAEQFHIPQGNLRWYAAFHNEKHHPHVHLMVRSEDKREGYWHGRGLLFCYLLFQLRRMLDKQEERANGSP
ncbi:MAG TPA: hypothetical protein DDW30_06865 [Clostridiales bacterium]|nr:hypothetical protein [Clostridiales bacterium]